MVSRDYKVDTLTFFTFVRYYKQDKTITRDFLCMGKKRKGSKNDNHVELGKLIVFMVDYLSPYHHICSSM